eukprot:9477711-Pyramimonas_sp.AAC.1
MSKIPRGHPLGAAEGVAHEAQALSTKHKHEPAPAWPAEWPRVRVLVARASPRVMECPASFFSPN